MSEPEAVPLPREGEVFFDVRGEARTMRLSWYADSRVAVFSIWQGNRCTGTFRLPFGDLERMVRILQAGPRPREAPGRDSRYGPTARPGYAADTGRDYVTGVRYGPDPAMTWGREQRPADYQSPVYPGRPVARYADPESAGLRQAVPAHVAQVETRWLAAPEAGLDSPQEGHDRPSDTDLLGYPSTPGRHRPSGRR